jgi:uncharacterized membrane protein
LLWSNNALLFWMSLIPFVTAYLGRNHHAPLAVAAYGAVMTLTSITFLLLQLSVSQQYDVESAVRSAFRKVFWKSSASAILYALSVPIAFLSVYVSLTIFVIFPLLYCLPEKAIAGQPATE